MPKICYIPKDFRPGSMDIISTANEIISEYQADGLDLTLRQLYYQFVARGYLANKQKEYKRLGAIISDARLAGLIDWQAIEDRTRNLKRNSSWNNPGEIIEACLYSYKLDHWRGQEHHVEVWIEKEALVGVISSICSELDVAYYACKGYVSQSEQWRAGRRFYRLIKEGRRPVVIHLGDHDPSGIDMTRDNQDRLSMFSTYEGLVKVNRIALNSDQVEQYNPPPNPVKLTDSRAGGYSDLYGDSSWELDALEPRVLRGLIEETVKSYRDDDIYFSVLDEEAKHKAILENIKDNWRDL